MKTLLTLGSARLTRVKSQSAALALVTAAALTGCGDSDDAGPAGQGDGVTIGGRIAAIVTDIPVENAEICVQEPDLGCVSTDEAGIYAFDNAPKNTRLFVSVRGPGFLPAGVFVDTGTEDRDDVDGVAIDEELLSAVFGDAGVTIDMTKGHALVLVSDDENVEQSAAGYAASVAPQSGEGPFFFSGATLDTAATATDPGGLMGLVNLEPGDYALTIDGPGPCGAAPPNAYDGNNTLPLRIIEGGLSAAVIDCRTAP